jgi:hypothetical protein
MYTQSHTVFIYLSYSHTHPFNNPQIPTQHARQPKKNRFPARAVKKKQKTLYKAKQSKKKTKSPAVGMYLRPMYVCIRKVACKPVVYWYPTQNKNKPAAADADAKKHNPKKKET